MSIATVSTTAANRTKAVAGADIVQAGSRMSIATELPTIANWNKASVWVATHMQH
jgi:hypothetical protein